ncbi:MAG: helix-turn-helix transcriptional regulator [Faecalibacterium sp.]|nr:helix-turn-helix transcriptional regulator [Ruminococcus sp.]MCM1392800.1 helix-turn-helix transcriptional regulator [Ruminococcus sp.]MCM1484686.1 helix-turn-helix transcriptional regulator [Faecalibacterium sp.]
MQYYEKLKEERKKRGYTQEEIAQELGITQQQYYLYEKGKRQLPIELLIKICNFYRISSDEILGIDNSLKAIQNECKENKKSSTG